MNYADAEANILKLFSNDLFLKLLDERISTSAHYPLETSSSKIFASDLVSDISQEIYSVIVFNWKSVIRDEWGNDVGEWRQLRKELEEVKARVAGLWEGGTLAEKQAQTGDPPPTASFEHFEESLEQEKVRLQEKNTQSSQLIKLKSEIQAIKSSLLRFTGVLSDVSPTKSPLKSQNINKLDDSRLLRLAKDLHNLSTCAPSVLDENSLNTDRFCVFEKQLDAIRRILDTKISQDLANNEKYENSFRSLWNIVTMMEANIGQTKRQLQGKLDQLTQKKGGGFMGKIFH